MFRFVKACFGLLISILSLTSLSAQPIISSFSPTSGPAGTVVTVSGANFNTSAGSNIVFFGGVKAVVVSATSTSLTVTAPVGATYDPISVLNSGTRLIGYSNKAFLETFNSGATAQTIINATRFPAVNFSSALPEAPVAVDIDGDGKPDIVVNNGGVAMIYRNTSTPGTINYSSLAAYVTFYAGQGDANLVLRDLNGDGKPDLICSSNQNNFHAYISVNTSTPGHISFSGAQAYAFSGGLIDAADMDGDGRLDLVMANQGGVALWLNTTPPGGALSFANPVTYGISGNTFDLSVMDIDGDGKPDVVCANAGDKTISILRNTTPRVGVANDSSFAPYLVIPTNRPAGHLMIRDIDADGKPDIIVSTDSGIAVLKNVATPGSITGASFASEVDIPIYAGITGVAVADLDGDGKPDIATSSVARYGGFVSILKNITAAGNISTASFALHTDVHAGGWGDGVFIADVDGDNRPEIIISNSNTPAALSILQPVINTQAPVINGVTPDSATFGTTVTIHGTNFSSASAVSFGGLPAASFITQSDTVITAILGNGASGTISVTTGLGTGTHAGLNFILYPAITAFTPVAAGRGDTVTITGSRFTEADTVTFGGVPATWFTVVNDNTIKALIGNNGASGLVVVKTVFGADTSAGFTYNPYPLLTSFTPTFGKTGDVISVHGKYLSTATALSFGGTPATSFTIVSDTVVTAVVGNGGIGAINVMTPAGAASLEEFTYIYPTPTLTGFTPVSGPAGTAVTITGSGFDPVAANNIVYFGGARAFVSQASAGSLTVTVPAGATYAPLTVTTHHKTVYGKKFGLTFPGGGALGSGSFAAPASIAPGWALTLVDADGDGKLDIATSVNNTVSLIRNISTNGTVTFSTPASAPSPTGISPQAIHVADFDGDGFPDLTTGYSDGYPAIVYPNASKKGSVSLNAGIKFSGTALDASYVEAGDFNQDGKPDIAAAGTYSNAITVLTNTTVNSNFAFGVQTTAPLGQGPNATLVDDFDGDGKVDAIVDGYYTGYIYVFRNTSPVNGTISLATQTNIYDYGIQSMVSGDIDGDGKPDLIVGSHNNAVYVYLNTSTPGSISFAAPFPIGLSDLPGYIAVGDLDGDGKIDIVTSGTATKTMFVLHNTSTAGALSFDPTVSFATSPSPGMVAIGDVNGDGKPDIVLNANAQQYVYLNQVTAPSAPTLTSFTPTSAAPGATVTINGTNLTGTTSVTFGGAPAASFTVVSDNQITAIPGQGASGSVLVTTPNGSASADLFTYVSPAAQITGFTPAHAAAGTVVTITGSNLDATTSVTFGGVQASSFTIASSSIITAVVGPAAVSGSVALFSTAGADSLGGFSSIPPTPTITVVTPASALPGATVTITGTGFAGATLVSFGGTSATSYTVVSPTTITAVVGGGSSGAVTITSPQGTISGGSFTYIAPLSRITSFNPTSGPPGTQVTIVGTLLNGVANVQFGGVVASSFTSVSPDTVLAVVGTGGTGAVSVTDQYGTTTLGTFTLTNPVSSITSFSPGSATTNMTVTITGTHLSGVTGVSFGGTAASSFSVVSDNSITAVVGSGATGNVAVTTPSGSLTLPGFTFAPYIQQPVISTMYPTSGHPGDKINLYGQGFTGTSSVTIGGIAAAGFSVTNDGILVVTVGNGATGPIVVTNSAGSASSGTFLFYPAPPVLTSFSPQSGPGGTLITIKGANLTSTFEVTVGSSLGQFGVLNLTVVSDSVVTGNVNPLSSSGPVTVYTNGGTVSIGQFTVLPAGTPVISAISPVSGGQGTIDTITGVNFNNVSYVGFGGVPASSFTVVSSTLITAVVGPGATGSVEIETSSGFSPLFSGFTYTGDTTSTPPPPVAHTPMLYSFSPNHAKQGDTVTLRGLYLDSVYSVTFGGVTATSIYSRNDSTIRTLIGTGASGNIIVYSPQGNDTLYNFVYDTTAVDTTTPPPPVTTPPFLKVLAFSPTHATKGDTVIVFGANFDSAYSVAFGGTPARSFRLLTDSTIIAVVGAGSGGKVFVDGKYGLDSLGGFAFDTTASGQDTGSIPPPVTPPPVVTPVFSISPLAATVVANQAVLNWKTQHEQQIAYYGIEAGTDTIHFTTVAQIVALEQDSAIYTYTDTATRSGVNFYRLVIVNGALDSSFSNIVAVQLAGVPVEMTVSPNPVTGGYFTVNVPAILNPSKFQLVDMVGNVVQLAQVDKGTTQVKIMVTSSMSGIYKLIWSDGSNFSFQTIMILKK